MKFAKELEREAVPEWRIKYLNYKAGKKHIKAVSRAIDRANGSPGASGRLRAATFLPPLTPRRSRNGKNEDNGTARQPATSPRPGENLSLTNSGDNRRYGSISATPEERVTASTLANEDDNDFELPAPAMQVQSVKSQASDTADVAARKPPKPSNVRRSFTMTVPPAATTAAPSLGGLLHHPTVSILESPGHLRRLFTHTPTIKSDPRVEMQNLDVVREREKDFLNFLNSELDKVETFYKMKEEQAGERLDALRVQLHEMRNRRIEEMAQARDLQDERLTHHNGNGHSENGNDKLNGWVKPIKSKMFPMGPNSKNLREMGRTPSIRGGVQGDASRDYIRRPEDHQVSYRTAKRKLKLALQEFYRGLELLKSFAMLNRTAFRKLNKKYDKAVNAHPPYRYMNEKVNKAWFVNSDVLENHIQVVEDLYARYFERGNHKLAAGKLRKLNKKPEDQSAGMFQNGLLIGTGAVFAIQGLIYGSQLLFVDDPTLSTQTSYLLQIYGGYFLMLLLFALFCIDCAIWNKNKVNYPFIFEFDQRHSLDWRELAQFPSFFFFLFGLFMWLNFSRYGAEDMYIYYPVVLIFVSIVIVFFPAPVLFYKSRKWFVYSHWRLLLAGLYPVEFRDFFLGDIYCSLTYATANIELFFCLYAHSWDNPTQCNSSHSRLLGFLTALPPIWRLLQCLRRYRDTHNVFPHLVNGGKYTATIITAVMLSLFRINGTHTNLGLFIAFATINGIYCSIWDLFMDFSLLQPNSRHWCLRDILALKRRWLYYFIMVVDPILRFAWVFYAIFTHNPQHSTIVSFMIALLEVVRRGMWALFRVENEHCANVSQYKASRDVPLPYRMEPLIERVSMESVPVSSQGTRVSGGSPSGAATTTGAVPSPYVDQGLTRRRTTDRPPAKRNFSRILAEAHKQDFEKRRRPVDAVEEDAAHGAPSDDDESDEVESLLVREDGTVNRDDAQV
ncbi:EXS family-domain-containing protein [Mariannaea sp. PMI_226]|nr:EXS family-domain-containing protein [Mariannaea sp. PMI_226]